MSHSLDIDLMREDSSLQRFMRTVEHDPTSDYIAPPPREPTADLPCVRANAFNFIAMFQRKAKHNTTPGPSSELSNPLRQKPLS